MHKVLENNLGQPLDISSHQLAHILLGESDMPVVIDGLGKPVSIVELAIGEQITPIVVKNIFVIEVRPELL